MKSIGAAIDRFFHARTKHAFAVAGILRIGYAVLVLYDRCILTLDFDHFFLHTMPLSVSSRNLYPSILWLAPDNAIFYYCVHAMSFVFAIFLLLGIAPRVQLAGLLVTMSAFWTHNNRIWDAQDNIFRFWAVFLLCLPIQSVSIYDGFRLQSQDHRTWAMWPFRIWQFQLMAIYSCAGLAKLAVPEWQSGRAMLHVVQTTDFYGGIFNPEVIFNRMGPLMIMTYASLVVECAGLVTAWIWPLPTVIAMFGLHLGIETAMNMHCLEWLCMLGWLTFLVQPEKDTPVEEPLPVELNEAEPQEHDESMETVDVSSPPEEASDNASEASAHSSAHDVGTSTIAPNEPLQSSEPLVSKISQQFKLRHLGTCILIYIGVAIFLETAPLERFHGLLPAVALPYLQRSIELQKYLAAAISHPITTPLRLRQAGWYMYSIPPMESYRFEIVMTHTNASTSVWESPKWETMTWYQKKRWQRPMSFYDCLSQASWEEHDAFTRYIAQQHETVASLQLYQHREGPAVLPNDLAFGFFQEAIQPLERFQTNHLYSLNLCADLDARCPVWAEEGYCQWPIHSDMRACRYSCGYCQQSINALSVGSRVAIFWPYDQEFFRATVRQVQQDASRPQVQLEYDSFFTDEDRYEWFDQHLLWQRQLIILEEELDTKGPNEIMYHDEL